MTTSIGGLFTSPPEIVSWGPSEINLFAFAVGTDQALWYAQLDGFTVAGNNAWSGWQSLGGVVMSRPRAVRSGELSVDVFAVGAHSELLHWQFRNGAWASWPIVGTVGGAVTMASRVVPPTLHRNWESLGGIVISPPHAVMVVDQGICQRLVAALGHAWPCTQLTAARRNVAEGDLCCLCSWYGFCDLVHDG
jgi:hypothetical protein